MAAIKVCIERDEQGQFTVGIDQDTGQSVEGLMSQPSGAPAMPSGQHAMPDGQSMGEQGDDTAAMQPATDLEDALNKARALLAGQPTEQQAFAAA